MYDRRKSIVCALTTHFFVCKCQEKISSFFIYLVQTLKVIFIKRCCQNGVNRHQLEFVKKKEEKKCLSVVFCCWFNIERFSFLCAVVPQDTCLNRQQFFDSFNSFLYINEKRSKWNNVTVKASFRRWLFCCFFLPLYCVRCCF